MEAECLHFYQVPRLSEQPQFAKHWSSAVPGPAAAASPGNLLEMQIFRPRSRTCDVETVEVGLGSVF